MIIGLTGGIASGKTFCSDYFQRHGIAVVDADVVAREVVQKGSHLLQSLQQLLGKEVLLADGNLHRAWLRERMFADSAVKQAVNALMHPAIRTRAEAALTQAEKQSDWILYSAPLLFENGLENQCEAVIFVDILPDLQIARALSRDGVAEAQIRAIIQAQLPREEKLSRSNFVIDNSGSREHSILQCQHLLTQLMLLSRIRNSK